MSVFSLDQRTKTAAALAASAGIAAITLALMPGCNNLDCTSSPQLSQSYQKGVSTANSQMAQDDANGFAAGMALTNSQGFNDGVQIGYSNGFNAGRADITSYNQGRNDGYNIGRQDGLGDVYSSDQGDQDGFTDGYADFRPTGEHDGYEDGYADGYDAGFAGGLVAPCSGSGAPTAEDMNSCETQGYRDTYRNTSFQNGFLRGKQANTNYQNGLTAGKNQGYIDGLSAGLQQAYEDGKYVGYEEGYTEGSAIAYTDHYNSSYINGQNQGYSEGYNDPLYGYGVAPSIGSYTNGTGGFGDGAFDGFIDGRDSQCGGSGSLAKKPAKRFGNGQSWAKTIKGAVVDAFVQRISRTRLTAESTATIKASIQDSRAKLRSDKLWEISNR